jgi:hypothetical protein
MRYSGKLDLKLFVKENERSFVVKGRKRVGRLKKE